MLTTLLLVLLLGGVLPAVAGDDPPELRIVRDDGPSDRDGPDVDEFILEADTAPYVTIDPTVGATGVTSIAVLDDRLAIAYVDGSPTFQLRVWYDDGAGGGVADDSVANGSEIRIIDTLGQMGTPTVSLRFLTGRLAVTYSDGVAGPTGTDLFFWYDDGRGGGTPADGVANGSEIRTVGTNLEAGGSLFIESGRIHVLWREDCCGFRLWVDDGAGGGLADDGVPNGAEIRATNLDPTDRMGNGDSFTFVGGRIAVPTWVDAGIATADLGLWVDDGAGAGIAGDFVVNGDEFRILGDSPFIHPPDYWTSTAVVNGQLAIAFQEYGTAKDLKLFLDDGGIFGDGTAGDNQASASEFRRLMTVGDVGVFSDIAQVNGVLTVSAQYVIPPQLKLFVDDGNDGAVPVDQVANGGIQGLKEPPESRGVDAPVHGGGFGASITSFDPDPSDVGVCQHIAISHFSQCNTCGFLNDSGVNLTTLNIFAPRGQFIHDAGDHVNHTPITLTEEIDITVRWFNDGSDVGEVFISGDVTGPGTGIWIPFTENLGTQWPDFMTVPVSVTPGDGEKQIFVDFRASICNGGQVARTITLDSVALADPENLRLDLAGGGETLLDWDDVVDPDLTGYNVYRSSDLNITVPGAAPDSWLRRSASLVPPGFTEFSDAGANFGSGISFYFYYVTAVDPLGNESSIPPAN